MPLKVSQTAPASEAYLLILHPDESLGEQIAGDFARILEWDLYIARQRLRLRAPQILKKTAGRQEAERLFIELSALGLKITLAAERELKKIPPPRETKKAKLDEEALTFIPFEEAPLVFAFSQGLLAVRGALNKEIVIASAKGRLRKPLVLMKTEEPRRMPVDPLYCTLADFYSPAQPQGARVWLHKFNFDLLGKQRETSPFLNFNKMLELLKLHFSGVAEDDNFKWLPPELKERKERKIFSDLGLGTTKEQTVIDNLEQFNQYSQLRFAVQKSSG